jgi:hypothetical protein
MRSSIDRRSLRACTPMPDSRCSASSIDRICEESRVNCTRTFMLRLYVAIMASSPGRMTVFTKSFISLNTRLRLNGARERLST